MLFGMFWKSPGHLPLLTLVLAFGVTAVGINVIFVLNWDTEEWHWKLPISAVIVSAVIVHGLHLLVSLRRNESHESGNALRRRMRGRRKRKK